jgi:hypothetical protein
MSKINRRGLLGLFGIGAAASVVPKVEPQAVVPPSRPDLVCWGDSLTEAPTSLEDFAYASLDKSGHPVFGVKLDGSVFHKVSS